MIMPRLGRCYKTAGFDLLPFEVYASPPIRIDWPEPVGGIQMSSGQSDKSGVPTRPVRGGGSVLNRKVNDVSISLQRRSDVNRRAHRVFHDSAANVLELSVGSRGRSLPVVFRHEI